MPKLTLVSKEAGPDKRISLEELTMYTVEQLLEDILFSFTNFSFTTTPKSGFELLPSTYIFLPINVYRQLKGVTVGNSGLAFIDGPKEQKQKVVSYERLNEFNNRLSLPLPKAEYEQFMEEQGGLPPAGIDVLGFCNLQRSFTPESRNLFLFPRVTQVDFLHPQGMFQVQRVILAYLNPEKVEDLVEKRFVYQSP